MDIQSIVLALIQGLTEFLPISSSAHLLLPKELLGWPDQGLAFDVAVHTGTLVAVVFYFRHDLLQMLKSLVAAPSQQRNQSRHLIVCLVIATIPAGLTGLFLESIIENYLRTAAVIATTTLLGAVLLWLADRRSLRFSHTDLVTITYWAALIIGLAQAFALIPGTSRSGITITMALFLGLSRVEAARFSFLMAIPIITLSGAWQAIELFIDGSTHDWLNTAIAAVIAGLSALACIRLFLGLIERIGMLPFVIYRLALGCGLALFLVF